MTLKTHKILIVGAGSVGSAICRGLLSSDASFQMLVYDLNKEKAESLACEAKVRAICSLSDKVVKSCDVILLAVKPHDLSVVGPELAPFLTAQKHLVLSVLAGKTIGDLEAALRFDGRVVRAMPNIAALIGQSATAIACSKNCNQSVSDFSKTIFDCIGTTVVVDEQHIDAVTGLSGSGPAYVYLFLESLIDGGIKMGLTREVARKLALQTLIGAASLAVETDEHPAILSDKVTTPGGTTIDALHELEKKGLRSMVMDAVEVATLKSKKLSKK